MKMSITWKGGKAAHKRARSLSKPKIRWTVLGLQDPADAVTSASMEDIRRQASSLASRGFGTGTRSRSVSEESQALGNRQPIIVDRKRRRGATE